MKEGKDHKERKHDKHSKKKRDKEKKRKKESKKSRKRSASSSSGSDSDRNQAVGTSALSQLERERAAVQAARYLLATQPGIRKDFRDVSLPMLTALVSAPRLCGGITPVYGSACVCASE